MIPVHGHVLVTVKDILTLINIAEDYGFDHHILYTALANWLNNQLSDLEIAEYAGTVASPPCYTHDDLIELQNKLIKWRNVYCKQRPKEI